MYVTYPWDCINFIKEQSKSNRETLTLVLVVASWQSSKGLLRVSLALNDVPLSAFRFQHGNPILAI